MTTTIIRRPVGIMRTFGGADANAEPGYGDDGLRVIHCYADDDWFEVPRNVWFSRKVCMLHELLPNGVLIFRSE